MKTKREEHVDNRYFEFRNLHGQSLDEELAELVKEAEGKEPRTKIDWRWRPPKRPFDTGPQKG